MVETVSWPRRVWRDLYWWRKDCQTRVRYRGVEHVVFFGGDGIGDELLCSTPLHELRRRGERGLCAMTTRPEFFHRSPDVDVIHPMAYPDLAFLRRIGVRVSQSTYIDEKLAPDIDVAPPRHLLAEMCRKCGVTGPIDLRPHLWLSNEERAATASFAGAIIMQSSRRSASLSIGNKEWLPERFQEVADSLTPKHRVIQIGSAGDPLLRGVEDYRGRLSLRQCAAMLSHTAAFVGLVGFLMHLARAVDCPSVIVYGGREHPSQSGYACNENIFTALPCSPCWRWNSCDFERSCMTSITANAVVAACGRLLARPRTPLEIERTSLA